MITLKKRFHRAIDYLRTEVIGQCTSRSGI